MTRRLATRLALFLCLLPSAAAGPVDQGQRVFITGHSFHIGIRAPLAEIAESAGIKGHELVGTHGIGGSRVLTIWNVPDDKSPSKAALKTGKVDVLTTSPHRQHPDEGLDKFVDLALAHNPNVRVTVQQSWMGWDSADARDPDKRPVPEKEKAPIDRDSATAAKLLESQASYYKEFEAQIDAINQRVGKPVCFTVPSGRAVIALREKVRLNQAPGIATQSSLFTDRIGHTGPVINVLNAYCHYTVIYRRSPVGLPVSKALAGAKEKEALNKLLQEIAWEAVTRHPQSGVTADAK